MNRCLRATKSAREQRLWHKPPCYSTCLRRVLGAGPYFQKVSESYLSWNNHSATLLHSRSKCWGVWWFPPWAKVQSQPKGANWSWKTLVFQSSSYRSCRRQQNLKLRKTNCPSKPKPGTSETWFLFPVPLPACGLASSPPHPSVSSLKSLCSTFAGTSYLQWDAQATFSLLAWSLKAVFPSQEDLLT